MIHSASLRFRPRSSRGYIHWKTKTCSGNRCSTLRAGLHQGIRTVSTSADSVRDEFLQFFERHDHTRVPSSSLVPSRDPSLLFTNAGMVQFKEVFQGGDTRAYSRATTAQRCMRAGGKHNDLENVGYTDRHQTLFEMLGNFSFGDYFKEEAIYFAWKFLTDTLQLPSNRLRVTVLESDTESEELWRKVAGLGKDRIMRCDASENEWSMGDTGPCGPCTEIFWDQGENSSAAAVGERWLEIWNLVFMQFDRRSVTEIVPLPRPCVDTGMGLERICSVLQGAPSNFEIDMFKALIDSVKEVANLDASIHTCETEAANSQVTASLRVISDHIRAISMLMADGVVPSNVGRGYVLRRIIRRASRHGQRLGMREPFLPKLLPATESSLAGMSVDLANRREAISNVLYLEESSFLDILERGQNLLEGHFENARLVGKGELPADVVFKLYDTYGFPIDIATMLATERGLAVDEEHILKMMEQQRTRAREDRRNSAAQRGSHISIDWQSAAKPTFIGYEHLKGESRVLKIDHGKVATALIEPCPFYPEGGGQMGDIGVLKCQSSSSRARVTRTWRPFDGGIAVEVAPDRAGESLDWLKTGTEIFATVDREHRTRTSVHHTATHLLHSALRSLIGPEVMQAGSSVSPARLRFDFTCGTQIKDSQLREIENFVNEVARSGAPVQVTEMSLEAAKATGAIANFDEAYGERVRVVKIGDVSAELCGGTHLEDAVGVYPFHILGETSVAMGTRRIEAVAGTAAVEWLQQQYCTLGECAAIVGGKVEEVPKKIQQVADRNKKQEKTIKALIEQLARSPPRASSTILADESRNIFIHMVPADWCIENEGKNNYTAKLLQERSRFLCETEPTGVHVIVAAPHIMVRKGKNAHHDVHAGPFLQAIFEGIGGSGGGGQEFAQGRIGDAVNGDRIADAIARAVKQNSSLRAA